MADLAISSFNIPGYLGTELSTVEFVAVAHPDHPLHRLQDRYSLRCAPHVLGVLADSLNWLRGFIEIELNSALSQLHLILFNSEPDMPLYAQRCSILL